MPALALIFNAFVWGLSWFPFRHIESHGLHPVWTTCLIYLAIATVMGLVRRHAWKGFAAYPMLAVLGLAAGFTNVGFNWAVTQGDVVRVVLLFYLMPLWSVLLGWLLLGERPTGGALARVALALTGVVVVLKAPGTDWPVPSSLPDWLGLGGRLQLRGDQHRAAPPAAGAGRIARARDVLRLHLRGGRRGARSAPRSAPSLRRCRPRPAGSAGPCCWARASSSPTCACSTARRGSRPARPR
jgi:uncharacterized membrane protein